MNAIDMTAAIVRWTVVGFREKVYQACQGAPVQAAGTCDKCGACIRYVVRVKSTAGEVLDVGRDCAVTLEGGPELAEIRNAERAWEREQYLKSDAYREECERRESRAERIRRHAERAEVDCAMALACLRAIRDSARCSGYEHDEATRWEGALLRGDNAPEDLDVGSEVGRKLYVALVKALAPESRHVGSVGDKKVSRRVLFEAMIPCDTAYGTSWLHKFRSEAGEAIVWFSASGGLRRDDVGTWLEIVGTVKAHKDYQGEAQTALTRCKITK